MRNIVARLQETGSAYGLVALGICDAEPFVEAREEMNRRVIGGQSGRLRFTYTEPEISTDIRRSFPWAVRLVVCATSYLPAAGNPGFHQQMVYAVAMTTIAHFERALGRRVLWSPHQPDGAAIPENVLRLRIYPHALREANAYYDPEKKALLFGYFPAQPEESSAVMPGGIVFTCLSHDVIVHETIHAILDGLHPHFIEPTNLDVYAFPISSAGTYERILDAEGLDYKTSFGSYNELTFNPSACDDTSKLNPFSVPRIREAMNWLVDREYIVAEIMGVKMDARQWSH